MALPKVLDRSLRGAGGRFGILAWVERRLGITPTGLALVGLAVVAWAIGRRFASRPVLVLAYGLLLLMGVAWLAGQRKVALVVGRSKVPTRVREGQRVDIELSLTARRRLSTIVLEELLPGPFGTPKRFPLTSVRSGQELTRSYTFVPRRRGRYEVGPLVAQWSDPFGLTHRRVVLDEPVPIIVHPSTELVHDRVITRAWEDPPIRPPVSKPWPTGFEFYGMRDYVSGDDPRRIVWRATARTLDLDSGTGRYLVREAEQGISDRVNIFIDTDRSSHSPGDTSNTFEQGVRAAASLGVKHLKDGFAVSVWGNSGGIAVGLRGRRAELKLLDQLASVEREDARLVTALDRLMLDRSGLMHNIVITPEINRPAASRLRFILERGTHILLSLLLWEETDPATPQRAGMLGCGVVEISAGSALDRVFSRQAIGGRR